MERLHLTLDASIDELHKLSAAVSAFCSRNGIGEQLRNSLQLVCDEWVTNIVLHGYGGLPAETDAPAIELWLGKTDGETLELVILDGAPPFDPTEHPEPDVTVPLERRQTGGLGIHMIKKLMDRVEYARVGGRNRLLLTKKIRAEREGELHNERNDR